MSVLQSEPGGGPMGEVRVKGGGASEPLNQPIREQNQTRGLPAHRDYCEAAVTWQGRDNEKACFQSARFSHLLPIRVCEREDWKWEEGVCLPWGPEGRPEGAREGSGEVTSWRWWSRWWTQPLFAALHPLLKGRGVRSGLALWTSPPPPPTLRSDDCVRHFKEEKKYINMYKYSLLTWMNLFVGCFFMQCWGTMFIFLLTWWTPSPLPPPPSPSSPQCKLE